MKQTIEIEVPNGKRAVWEDGKIVFEDIKPQLPKTWKEFCDQNRIKEGEYYLDQGCHIIKSGISRRLKDFDRNLLPSKQAVEQHLALMQLHQLRDCYRQGWEPNSIDDSLNWCIRKSDNKIIALSTVTCSSFLLFPTREIAEEFLTNFKDLIEQAGDLI